MGQISIADRWMDRFMKFTDPKLGNYRKEYKQQTVQ